MDNKENENLEKINQNEIDIVYYAKLKNRKLFRIRLEELVSIKEKEQDGFTNAEVRFFSKVFEDKHILKFDDIKHILKHISMIGFKK